MASAVLPTLISVLVVLAGATVAVRDDLLGAPPPAPSAVKAPPPPAPAVVKAPPPAPAIVRAPPPAPAVVQAPPPAPAVVKAPPAPAVVGSPPPVPAAEVPKVPAILAFGDSIVDTGNNNYIRTIVRSNFPPYGKDFPGHKPSGRFSDGKISIDFLASALGVKQLVPPYLNKNLTLEELKTGVSFGSAGSGYDNATCRTMMAMTLERQLQLFAEYKAKVGSIPDKALYVMCWGTNDIVQHFTLGDGRTEPDYSDFMAQRASTFIQTLVSLGARRIAVTGAPPVGCVPSQRIIAGGIRKQCATDRNQLALLYNRKLSQEISKLSGKLPSVSIIFMDLYSVLADVIQRYQALGFKNGKDACCGYIGLAAGVLCNFASPLCEDPSQYVFWDSYHPTEKAYKVVIDQIVKRYFSYLH